MSRPDKGHAGKMRSSDALQTFFSYAFRPFFLLMAAFGILAMGTWLLVLRGSGPASLPVNASFWHAHEMLVGFGLAAIAGFALTAVATWTGRPPVRGWPLALLVLSWLAGRVGMWIAGVANPLLVAVLDMAFPLLLLTLLAREVFGAGNARNFPVVYVVGFLAACNGLFHASLLGLFSMAYEAERAALYLFLHTLLLMITIIAGRIVPNFTANWLRARGHRRLPSPHVQLDRITLATTGLTGLYFAVLPFSLFTAWLALVCGLLHALRLSRWRGLSTWREPLLFVLHVAYAWLPVGYILTAASIFGWGVAETAALHALTVGCVSLMVLGVSTRVSLAHTGRRLFAARTVVLAYGLMLMSAVVRVLSPRGAHYLDYIDVAAGAWILSFVLFLVIYAPVLSGPAVEESG